MAGKAKDLIGYTTESGVTVIERAENKGAKPQWLCRCFCGKEFITRSDALKSGHTKSCGCLQKKKASENIIKQNKSLTLDLTNQKFGRLTALYSLGIPKKGGTSILWQCKCDCGNHCQVAASKLKTYSTMSCGCLSSKGEAKIQSILEQNNIIFETQKQFDNCRVGNNIKARFDFYIPNENYLIEYDGNVHYYCNNQGWNNKENLIKVKNNDKIKNKWCKENNIPLIRIPYTIYDIISLKDLLLKTSKYIVNVVEEEKDKNE